MYIKKTTIKILILLVIASCQQSTQKETVQNENTSTTSEKTSPLYTGSWVQPNPINEKEVQGFTLKSDSVAESINMATLLYKKWWIENEQLVLIAESIGNHSSSVDTMKYEVVQHNDSILEIKNNAITERYTRKQ